MSAARPGNDADNDATAASATPPTNPPHFIERSTRLRGYGCPAPIRLRPAGSGGNGNRGPKCAFCRGVAILPWLMPRAARRRRPPAAVSAIGLGPGVKLERRGFSCFYKLLLHFPRSKYRAARKNLWLAGRCPLAASPAGFEIS